jgi:acyl-CoA synthetase (NDP forming)
VDNPAPDAELTGDGRIRGKRVVEPVDELEAFLSCPPPPPPRVPRRLGRLGDPGAIAMPELVDFDGKFRTEGDGM